ncbi:MAG: hypothetical protein U0936_20305 [Planctomycetaceae bacterium]
MAKVLSGRKGLTLTINGDRTCRVTAKSALPVTDAIHCEVI